MKLLQSLCPQHCALGMIVNPRHVVVMVQQNTVAVQQISLFSQDSFGVVTLEVLEVLEATVDVRQAVEGVVEVQVELQVEVVAEGVVEVVAEEAAVVDAERRSV